MRRLCITTLICHVLLASAATGRASGNWDGGGTNDNWSTALNWSDDVAPLNNGTANIYFAGAPRTSPDLDLDWSVASVSHNSSGEAFTLRSTSARVLTTGEVSSYGRSLFGGDSVLTVDLALTAASSGMRVFGTVLVNGPIALGGTGQTLRLGGSGRLNGSVTIAGTVTGSGALVAENLSNRIVSNSALTGSTTIARDGSLSIEGAGGTLSATSAVNLLPRGSLTIGDSSTTSANPNRLNDAAPISSRAGAFTLIGSNNITTTREQTGAISILQGDSMFAVRNAAAGFQTELAVAGLNRTPGATLVLTGDNLGLTGPSSTRFLVSGAAPETIGGGGADGTPQVSIVPWAVGSNALGDSGSTLVTYGANGFRPLNPATEYVPAIAAADANDNVRVAASQSSPGAKTVNSLVIDNNAAVALDSTLGLNSGVILFTNGGSINGGTLGFGAREGIVRSTAGPASIGSDITGSGGLTTSGAGGVTLSGANSYGGRTVVNDRVIIANNAALGLTGAGNETLLLPNSRLEITGAATNVSESIQVPQNAATQPGETSIANIRVNSLATLNGSVAFTGAINSNAIAARLTISDSVGATMNAPITSETSGPGTLQLRYEMVGNVRSTFNSVVSDGTGKVSLSFGSSNSAAGGAIAVNSVSTHTGGTAVGISTRVYFNNTSGSGSGAGGVGVDFGGVIGGVGILDPADGGIVSLAGGGFGGAAMAPGDPTMNGGIGTLTIGSAGSENSLFVAQGNSFQLQVGSASDMVRIFGGVQFAPQSAFSSGIRFSILDGGGATPGTYPLITYTTEFNGPFNSATLSMPAGWSGTLVNNLDGKSIDLQLQAVPEPGTVALLAMAAGAVAFRRFRRGGRESQ